MTASSDDPVPQTGPAPCAHGPRNASILARRPLSTGILVGFASLAPHLILSPPASLGFAAVLIALIGGIYFGFAVMNGSPRDQLVEFSVAGAFAIAGLVGLIAAPVIIPLAYIAHALWDLAHHNRLRLALVAIPQWYVPWCAVIDIIIGTGLLLVWTRSGVI